MFGKEYGSKSSSLRKQFLKNLEENPIIEPYKNEKELRELLQKKIKEGKLF